MAERFTTHQPMELGEDAQKILHQQIGLSVPFKHEDEIVGAATIVKVDTDSHGAYITFDIEYGEGVIENLRQGTSINPSGVSLRLAEKAEECPRAPRRDL